MKACSNLIGGEWVGASDDATFETRDPAHADEALGSFPSATSADAAQAVAAAAEAFPAWAATPAPARGAILFRAAELLDERLDDDRHDAHPRGGQDARRGEGRGHAGPRHPAVLRRRGLAGRRRRAAGQHAERHAIQPARAARRGRGDHAVELPDRHPGMEDRAGARRTATPWSSSRLRRRRSRRCGWSSAWWTPACRPASSTSSPAPAPSSAARSPATPSSAV